jgi:hypothetical protein
MASIATSMYSSGVLIESNGYGVTYTTEWDATDQYKPCAGLGNQAL